jgi:hypothetical protein
MVALQECKGAFLTERSCWRRQEVGVIYPLNFVKAEGSEHRLNQNFTEEGKHAR